MKHRGNSGTARSEEAERVAAAGCGIVAGRATEEEDADDANEVDEDKDDEDEEDDNVSPRPLGTAFASDCRTAACPAAARAFGCRSARFAARNPFGSDA